LVSASAETAILAGRRRLAVGRFLVRIGQRQVAFGRLRKPLRLAFSSCQTCRMRSDLKEPARFEMLVITNDNIWGGKHE
jgi:hypothetical protein